MASTSRPSRRLHKLEPWTYVRDVLCLLSIGWPAHRLLDLAPVSWAQKIANEDVQRLLAANPYRALTLMAQLAAAPGHARGRPSMTCLVGRIRSTAATSTPNSRSSRRSRSLAPSALASVPAAQRGVRHQRRGAGVACALGGFRDERGRGEAQAGAYGAGLLPAAEGWDGGVIGVRGGDGDRDAGAGTATVRAVIAEKACVAGGLRFPPRAGDKNAGPLRW